MKCTYKLLLVLAMSCVFCFASKANDEIVSEMDTVTVNVRFADYFNETIKQDTIDIYADGFHITLTQPLLAIYNPQPPAYSHPYECVQFSDGNEMKIVHDDSLHMICVKIPPQLLNANSAPNLSGAERHCPEGLDSDENLWRGDCPLFIYRFDKYKAFGKEYNYLFFKNIEITYLRPKTTSEKKIVRMTLHDVRIRTVASGMARLDFSLDVEDDDDVKDFTITANDADNGTEYGTLTFDRYSFGSADAPLRAAESDDSSAKGYTIQGSTFLTGFSAGTRPLVNLAIRANYHDGTTSADSDDADACIQVSAPITTGEISPVADAHDGHIRIYDLMGRGQNAPAKGIYIIHIGSDVQKVYIR